MRCLSCKYNLKHLASHRCPECGRTFNPRDSRTFFIESHTRVPTWAIVYLFVCLGCGLVLLTFAAIAVLRNP